jgi:hypothetical protein
MIAPPVDLLHFEPLSGVSNGIVRFVKPNSKDNRQLAIEMEDLTRLHRLDDELLGQLAVQGLRIGELLVIDSARLDRAEQEVRAARGAPKRRVAIPKRRSKFSSSV